jgi:uncharacterized protein YecE (DUF72 family)
VSSSLTQFLVDMPSWTDAPLVNSNLFYPPLARSAEERLRFYAERFKTVEVDSTYYALPAERNARLWSDSHYHLTGSRCSGKCFLKRCK